MTKGAASDVCSALLDEFEEDFKAEWEELTQLRARRATGWGSEEARLRLDNLRGNSTTPERIIQALEKKALDYLGVMRDHLHLAVQAAIKLEHAERELEATYRLIEVRAQERAETRAIEIYPEAKRVIDLLYEKYGIAMGHFSTLGLEEIAALAAIIKSRFQDVTGRSPR